MHITKYCINLVFVFHSTCLLAGSDDHHDHSHDLETDESLFEEHSSHVHGHASAQVSYENGVLNINKSFSSIDIFGFEHEPKNDEQKIAIKQAVKNLEMTEKLFRFNGNSCELESVKIESDLIKADVENHEEHHDHDHEHHHDEESSDDSHSDVYANYKFKCDNKNINSIEYSIFDYFPTLEELEVQYIGSDHQALFNATPTNRIQELNK